MSSVEKFLADVKKTAKEHDVKIMIVNKPVVYAPGEDSLCAGYFDEDDRVLCVAKSASEHNFYSTFVHESSHMDQWIQDSYMWTKCSPGFSIFFDWLAGKSIYKREVLEESVQDIIRLELDCERRSLKKIGKYNLPVHVDRYVKGVNGYMYAYLYMLDKRKWVSDISDDLIYNASSTRLKKEYTKIPQRLRCAFDKVYNSPYENT